MALSTIRALLLVASATAACCSGPEHADAPSKFPHVLPGPDCRKLARTHGRFAPVARELCEAEARDRGQPELCVLKEIVVCSTSTAAGAGIKEVSRFLGLGSRWVPVW